MGGIFSSPSAPPPPEPVREALAPAGRNAGEKTATRNLDSNRQRRRAAAAGTGSNTILTSAVDAAAGEAKTLLGT